MPSQTLTSCWTTSRVDSVGWREIGAESADRATLIRCWTANDDGVPMSDNTLNKALRIMAYDTGPGGNHCVHAFRSIA
jgi:hypothetical protein